MKRATNEEIVAAYQQTGSVWKAGKLLGLAGQSVHERLVAIGHPLGGRRWTSDEDQELRDLAATGVRIAEIGSRLGRTYNAVACRMNELGIKGNQSKPRKIKRGAGYDKASMRRHLRVLEADPTIKVTRYARQQGLGVDSFVHAAQVHFPDRWDAYMAAHHQDVPRKTCPYCGTEFVPANGKQTYCTRLCGNRSLRDRSYFGGRRREAIGLAEGICQLCGNHHESLHAHHVIGKVNDPDDDLMVALCPGCHRLVGLAARTRRLVDDSFSWEALITLAWFEAHGHELPEDGAELWVSVEIRNGPVAAPGEPLGVDVTVVPLDHTEGRLAALNPLSGGDAASTDVMAVHEPVVLYGPHGAGSWAWCPCGWSSRLCHGRVTARQRADQHVTQSTGR